MEDPIAPGPQHPISPHGKGLSGFTAHTWCHDERCGEQLELTEVTAGDGGRVVGWPLRRIWCVASMGGEASRLNELESDPDCLDVYFGEEAGRQIDARALRMVGHAAQSGYIVMAADPGIATRWLADGSGAALTALVNNSESALHPDVGRPWVLWQGRRVLLAAMRPVKSPEDVALWVKAGVALVGLA